MLLYRRTNLDSTPLRFFASTSSAVLNATRCAPTSTTPPSFTTATECSSSNSSSQRVAALLSTSFALGACGYLSSLDTSSAVHAEPAAAKSAATKQSAGPFLGPDFIADAVSKAAPALVNISVEVQQSWGGGGVSTGSGFIITEDGYVVTNNHVVAAGFSGGGKVSVTLSNGRRYRARVHSRDQMSDLALIKIESRRENEKFPVMKLGTSSTLKPGQWVIALGSPLTLQNTVTAGIISSVARHASEIGMSEQTTEYIQTDAAINVGNSGGPLINIQGEVIGINTMKTAQGAGIGFAIPMDTAWQVVKQLRANRKVVRPWIGMKMVTLDPKVVEHERLQNPNFPPVHSGVMVVHVADGSPASQGGLMTGDIITSFDGRVVTNTRDILEALGMEIGKKISLVVLRDGAQRKLTIVSTAHRI